MLCFAYGSNMSRRRLQARIPSAQVVAVATLEAHTLKFHKAGRKDNSAKCDAAFTGNPDDRVMGVIYQIGKLNKAYLDLIEGLGRGYEEKTVELMTAEGQIMHAWMYYATDLDPTMKPYHWYKQHVLEGARECDFPEPYRAKIAATESVEDPNTARAKRELAIYK
jgi:gamma-glutamylcyclotransferase (GGCT)/AIG2-like uncharacterized protein YtfP